MHQCMVLGCVEKQQEKQTGRQEHSRLQTGEQDKKALQELVETLHPTKKNNTDSLDRVVQASTQPEETSSTVGEALAKAYTILDTTLPYAANTGTETYTGKTPTTPHHKQEKHHLQKTISEQNKQDLHSPVVNNEISIQQAGQKEQTNARHQNEYGKTLITPELTLEEKEKNYWWRMTNKALKELIYETAGHITWFVN